MIHCGHALFLAHFRPPSGLVGLLDDRSVDRARRRSGDECPPGTALPAQHRVGHESAILGFPREIYLGSQGGLVHSTCHEVVHTLSQNEPDWSAIDLNIKNKNVNRENFKKARK